MNLFLKTITDVQKEYPLTRKVFLAKNRQIGAIILKRSALRWGSDLVDFHSISVADLAESFIQDEMIDQALKRVTRLRNRFIFEQLLSSIDEEGYFFKLGLKPGIIETVAEAVDELRMNNISPDTIPIDTFISELKTEEIARLMAAYEAALKSERLIDDAAILKMAIKRPVKDSEEVVACLHASIELSVLEEEFLGRSNIKIIRLPLPKVHGLAKPDSIVAFPEDEGGFFSFLFAPAESALTESSEITIRNAVGKTNEVRQALRDILSSLSPFDTFEIVCPPNSDYNTILAAEGTRANIPITFLAGGPLRLCNDFRLLRSAGDFIGNGFRADMLYDCINNGDFSFVYEGVSERTDYKLTQTLRTEKIGWGRDRFEKFAAKKEDSRFECGTYTEQIKKAQAFVLQLLSCIPTRIISSAVSVSEAAAILRSILMSLSSTKDRDSESFSLLEKALSEYKDHSKCGAHPSDAFTHILNEIVKDVHGGQYPQPGAVFVSDFSAPGISGRPEIIFLGTNEGTFPAIERRDPILLDTERIKLRLPTSAEISRKKLYLAAAGLADHRGRLTISCLSFDLSDWSERGPAGLVLQAFRLRENKPHAAYASLFTAMGAPQSFVPPKDSMLIDERDWWLSSLYYSPDLSEAQAEAAFSVYHGLSKGISAFNARSADTFSPWDGLIKIRNRNASNTMSSSSLEKLGKCPRSYLFSYLLGIRTIDEIIWDAGVWLNGAEKGSMLHEVYRCYYANLRSEHFMDEDRLATLMEVFKVVSSEYADMKPAPSDHIYQIELNSLERDIRFFYELEEAEADDRCPRYFELSFGSLDKVLYGDMGLAEEIAVPSADSPIKIRGSIDRIDEDENGDFIVIDYKTGSPREYKHNDLFAKGTQLQWALYIFAARTILKKTEVRDVKIIESQYFFPTARGMGIRIKRRPEDADKQMPTILNALAQIRKNGLFVPHNKDQCEWCDYKKACFSIDKDRELQDEHMLAKRQKDPKLGKYAETILGG